jgi:hypothetical protein
MGTMHYLKLVFNVAGATSALAAIYYVGSAILAIVG